VSTVAGDGVMLCGGRARNGEQCLAVVVLLDAADAAAQVTTHLHIRLMLRLISSQLVCMKRAFVARAADVIDLGAITTLTTFSSCLMAFRLWWLTASCWRELETCLLVLALTQCLSGSVMSAAVVAIVGSGTVRRRHAKCRV
jgi:hypothetical protein